MTESIDCVAIVSGGMDSATMLYKLVLEEDYDVRNVKALSFDYGQRHRREIDSAEKLCSDLGVGWGLVDLRALQPILGGSCLTSSGIEVPEGHYAEESMKMTVVPNRNMIMLSIAIGHAVSLKAKYVAYGAHAGDHTIYPDCRETFATVMDLAAQLCDWEDVRLLRPFIEIDKGAIAIIGDRLGVPWQDTWTCYKGGEQHCGKCGSCRERRESFDSVGITDPVMSHLV